jgi:DNA-binding transcriptional LysR family regulator
MLRLELVPESRLVHLANRDADLAVTLTLPSAGPVFVRRLVDYRLGLYASHDYIAGRGLPETIADLRHHAMVGYIDDLIDLPELRVAHSVESQQMVFRSTSSTAQHNAIASGVGLGWLHSYVADHDLRLVRILDGVEEQRSYWLAVHRDQRDLPAVRAVIDFIDDIVATRFGRSPDREAATVRSRE